MKRLLLICIWVLPFLWSCSSDDSEEKVIVQMPIHLYISTDGAWHSHRSPGDPGEPQKYQLPRYLYAYFVQKLEGGGYNLDIMEEDLDPKKWKEVSNPNSPGLYAYEGNLSMLLSKDNIVATKTSAATETDESRVYAITSYDRLVFDAPTGSDGYTKVPNLQLDLSQNSMVDLLNVYANPLGETSHTNGAVSKKGEFLYETEVTCYHVAACIDIQWDINPTLQGTYKMNTIQLNNLPTKGYFFKHTANVEDPTGMVKFTADVGNQWYGRHVFYAFDRKEVDCTYTLSQKGQADKVVQKTYTTPTTGSHSNVYSSWYRINATFGY